VTMYVAKKRNRRFGTCAWCRHRNQKLTFTAYRVEGQFRTADICERCLNEQYRVYAFIAPEVSRDA